MTRLLFTSALLSLLLTGAIFGFFYAWVCSTMWGLDRLTPEVAIRAMQAMNASVRNAVFAPAFFGTGPALLVTALLAQAMHRRQAAALFGAAGVVYLLFGMVLTIAVNVPMNEALAAVDPTENPVETWAAYSPRWQVWNQIRTAASGLSLALSGLGLVAMARPRMAHG